MASSSLSSKGPNYQCGVLLISAGATEGHFEIKMPRECHQGGLVLHNNAPAQWVLATQNKLANLGFQYLDHSHYSPDLAPLDHHMFPGPKKQLKGRHFSFDTKAIAAVETWLDGQLSEFFFKWQKLQQWAKKCIELREECVEIRPEFGHCSLFPSWSG
jgi:hypothetical protein